jgi:hypothetical protein
LVLCAGGSPAFEPKDFECSQGTDHRLNYSLVCANVVLLLDLKLPEGKVVDLRIYVSYLPREKFTWR